VYALSNVTNNYQKGRRTIPALRGLNLVIGDGEWLAVQGRTGHGKTTLLQILGGLDRPSTGTVTFAGHDLWRTGRQMPGLMPQSGSSPVLPWRSSPVTCSACPGVLRPLRARRRRRADGNDTGR
jgi:ABC-type nitrate/sulfonate/bicarbonate transport system ATPase subunit